MIQQSRKKSNESPHIAEHPGEKGFCREQSMWHEEDDEKTAFGRDQVKNTKAKF